MPPTGSPPAAVPFAPARAGGLFPGACRGHGVHRRECGRAETVRRVAPHRPRAPDEREDHPVRREQRGGQQAGELRDRRRGGELQHHRVRIPGGGQQQHVLQDIGNDRDQTGDPREAGDLVHCGARLRHPQRGRGPQQHRGPVSRDRGEVPAERGRGSRRERHRLVAAAQFDRRYADLRRERPVQPDAQPGQQDCGDGGQRRRAPPRCFACPGQQLTPAHPRLPSGSAQYCVECGGDVAVCKGRPGEHPATVIRRTIRTPRR